MNRTIIPAPVRRTIEVAAPRAHCFDVFVRMGTWWPPTHSIGAAPQADAIVEPRVGGRWYERGADGSECDWGRVLAFEPPARIVFDWQIGGEWRFDPNVHTTVEVTFTEIDADRTLVVLEHRDFEGFGALAEQATAAISGDGGWTAIIALYAARAVV